MVEADQCVCHAEKQAGGTLFLHQPCFSSAGEAYTHTKMGWYSSLKLHLTLLECNVLVPHIHHRDHVYKAVGLLS